MQTMLFLQMTPKTHISKMVHGHQNKSEQVGCNKKKIMSAKSLKDLTETENKAEVEFVIIETMTTIFPPHTLSLNMSCM